MTSELDLCEDVPVGGTKMELMILEFASGAAALIGGIVAFVKGMEGNPALAINGGPLKEVTA